MDENQSFDWAALSPDQQAQYLGSLGERQSQVNANAQGMDMSQGDPAYMENQATRAPAATPSAPPIPKTGLLQKNAATTQGTPKISNRKNTYRSPEELQQLIDTAKKSGLMDAQNEGIAKMEAEKEKLANMPLSNGNNRGLATLADVMLAGNNYYKGFSARQGVPDAETPAQRQEKLIALENMIQEKRGASNKVLENLVGIMNKPSGYEGMGIGSALGSLQDRQDFMAHQNTIRALRNNKPLADTIGNYQRLGNALALIDQADVKNPESIHEFQQAVRKAIGMGNGGVGEREETYFKSMGLNGARLKEFITGRPEDVSNNVELLNHLRNLAHVEQANISNNISKKLSALSLGNSSMYARRPDYKSDLDLTIAGMSDQAAPPEQAPAAKAQPVRKSYQGETYELAPGADSHVQSNWKKVK